jgi:hypothetical protein
MPKEIGSIFVEGLSLNAGRHTDVVAKRQERLQTKLQELAEAHGAEDTAPTSGPR